MITTHTVGQIDTMVTRGAGDTAVTGIRVTRSEPNVRAVIKLIGPVPDNIQEGAWIKASGYSKSVWQTRPDGSRILRQIVVADTVVTIDPTRVLDDHQLEELIAAQERRNPTSRTPRVIEDAIADLDHNPTNPSTVDRDELDIGR